MKIEPRSVRSSKIQNFRNGQPNALVDRLDDVIFYGQTLYQQAKLLCVVADDFSALPRRLGEDHRIPSFSYALAFKIIKR